MYITLPSNSSKAYFPMNTASNFFTQLPQPLTFGEDYEVGLAEIQFDNTYANVRGACAPREGVGWRIHPAHSMMRWSILFVES